MVKFVIVVVCLNPGSKLKDTLNSIFEQSYKNVEVIIKDGMSTDGALAELEESGYLDGKNVCVIKKVDKSIYDAMNQAVENLDTACVDDNVSSDKGNVYVQFLNCGDSFYNSDVLKKVAEGIEKHVGKSANNDGYNIDKFIIYGNQYNEKTGDVVSSKPSLTEFDMYRNVPCHQVCFYDARLFASRSDGTPPYHTEYKVRGDYEHFLYSVYKNEAVPVYLDELVCNYEGGGYSETPENRKKSNAEHREITDYYMGKNAAKYRMIMTLSGAKIRTFMSESPALSGAYNKVKSAVYKIF